MKNVNRIKNLILSIFLFLLLLQGAGFQAARAEESIGEQLTKIETTLWDLNYQNETNEVRLKRIENEVFGTSNSKSSIQDRINKLNTALGLESLAEAKAPISELYKDEDSGINYPVVDMLEMQLLGQNYKKENIYKRLERLEGKVFGGAQKGDLAQRTDNLKAKIAVTRPSSSLPNYQTGEYYQPRNSAPQYSFGDEYTEEDIIAKSRSDAQKRNNPRQYDNYSYDYGYGGSDASLQIAGLENSLFGQTFSYDPMAVRLNRLERRIFQRDFASDDEYSRIARLQAASTAKKTAKYYDNNKFQKFAATGMQLGSIVLMILALLL